MLDKPSLEMMDAPASSAGSVTPNEALQVARVGENRPWGAGSGGAWKKNIVEEEEKEDRKAINSNAAMETSMVA